MLVVVLMLAWIWAERRRTRNTPDTEPGWRDFGKQNPFISWALSGWARQSLSQSGAFFLPECEEWFTEGEGALCLRYFWVLYWAWLISYRWASIYRHLRRRQPWQFDGNPMTGSVWMNCDNFGGNDDLGNSGNPCHNEKIRSTRDISWDEFYWRLSVDWNR